MTWQIIVNPHAGRRTSPYEQVSTGVVRRNLDAEVVETESLEHLHDTVGRAAQSGHRSFVAVGGDGTAHHVLNAALQAVPEASLRLSIIPAGSGSDFVRTFALPPDVDSGLDRLLSPNLYAIDIGRATGEHGTRYFLNALNSGVAADSVRVGNRLPRWAGGLRYTAGFWLALAGFPRSDIAVNIGRHRFSGNAINVVVANGQFFGGGLNIAPRATMVDGIFDVQVFSGAKRNAFTVMPRVVFGSHLTHRAVHRYLGGDIRIDAPDDWPLEADGELLGHGATHVSAIPGAVQFVI